MRSFWLFLFLPFLFHCGDEAEETTGDPSGSGGQAGSAGSSGVGAGLSLDPEFGDGGVLHVDRGFNNDQIYAAVRLDDGSIVAAGSNYGLGNVQEPIVVRFDPSGAPDAGFGQDGLVVLPVGELAWITEVRVAGSGLLVAGYMLEGIDAKGFVMKLDASGAVDPAFADEGVLRVPNDYGRPWVSMAQSDAGDIALFCRIGSDQLSLTRFDATGETAPAFSGCVAVAGEEPRALAFVGDDLLAASGDNTSGELRRIGANGALVGTFGSGGEVVLDVSPYALAVGENGTIWIGGGLTTLLSLDADGTP